MSGAKTASDRIDAEIDARLFDFDKHRQKLVGALRQAHKRGRKARVFDEEVAWQSLRFVAFIYYQWDREARKERLTISAKDRAKLFTTLGDALRNTRDAADDVMKKAGSGWFVEWAIANGNPDFLNGRIENYQDEFERRIDNLKGLEDAAYRAAEAVRRKGGRPVGTSNLPRNWFLTLASTYRDITGANPSAGPGPFTRFVVSFLNASGRSFSQQAIIEFSRSTKKQAPTEWGRSLF
jgi:hypothetical protein